MRPEIRNQPTAIIGEDSPLLAPGAQIAVRVGDIDSLVPVDHLRTLIDALCKDALKDVSDLLAALGSADQSPG
jgi:hypothetical protein